MIGIIGVFPVALLQALLSNTLRANQIVTGIGINILVLGATTLAYREIFGARSREQIPGLAKWSPPLLGDIPFFGKLFQSKTVNKSNSELLVIVTPELVEPVPEGQTLPDLARPDPFIQGPGILTTPPRTPGTDQTGPGPVRPPRTEISVQELQQIQKANQQPVGGTATPSTPSSLGPPLIINPTAAQPLPQGGDPGSSAGSTAPGKSN